MPTPAGSASSPPAQSPGTSSISPTIMKYTNDVMALIQEERDRASKEAEREIAKLNQIHKQFKDEVALSFSKMKGTSQLIAESATLARDQRDEARKENTALKVELENLKRKLSRFEENTMKREPSPLASSYAREELDRLSDEVTSWRRRCEAAERALEDQQLQSAQQGMQHWNEVQALRQQISMLQRQLTEIPPQPVVMQPFQTMPRLPGTGTMDIRQSPVGNGVSSETEPHIKRRRQNSGN